MEVAAEPCGVAAIPHKVGLVPGRCAARAVLKAEPAAGLGRRDVRDDVGIPGNQGTPEARVGGAGAVFEVVAFFGFLKLNNSIAHRVENKGRKRGREEGESCGGPKRGPQIEQTYHLRSREPRSAPKTP